MTRHRISVTLNLADEETVIPDPVEVFDQPYNLTNEQALDLVMPEGDAPTRLDFDSVPGFVRFGATMVPADRFRSLTAQVISASQLS